MARHQRNRGRTTPKGTRPGHLRPVGGKVRSPIDDLIDTGARDLLDEDDPIAAETWASGLLGMFDGLRFQARLERMDVPPFEEAVLERCRERRDRSALIVAAGLAAVVPPPLDVMARATVGEIRRSGVVAPRWAETVGLVTPKRAWVVSDVWDDQDSLIIGFSQHDALGEHGLVVLVDHNLSGQAKDAFASDDVDDTVAAWRENADDHMQIAEVPVDEALTRLGNAMAMSDLWDGDTELRTEDFAQHRALVWARLRRAGFDCKDVEAHGVPQEQRDLIVGEFLASSHGADLRRQLPGTDVELLATYLVDLRSDYEGRPLRWSPTVATLILADLAPRKLLLDADQATALPMVLRSFVRFAGVRAGLDDRFVQETLDTVEELEPEFLDRIGDPRAAGPAKAVLAALEARGVDLTDLDAINSALGDIGSIKLPEPAPPQRRRPTSAPADVTAAAESAPILARFHALVDFYGEGRKLTQTGQPTLADARALVDLLDTNDQMDQKIGARTFKTKSAAELPELAFILRWAVRAGALRKEHGRLRATAAWRKLEGKPVHRWLKAVDVLPSLGPLAGFYAHARYGGGGELLDEFAPEILRYLYSGPRAFDDVLDTICERADTEYEWLTPFMQNPEQRRKSFGWDLDRFSRILGWAGVLERVGAESVPNRYEPTRTDLVGGMLQLTALGRWWLAP